MVPKVRPKGTETRGGILGKNEPGVNVPMNAFSGQYGEETKTHSWKGNEYVSFCSVNVYGLGASSIAGPIVAG